MDVRDTNGPGLTFNGGRAKEARVLIGFDLSEKSLDAPLSEQISRTLNWIHVFGVSNSIIQRMCFRELLACQWWQAVPGFVPETFLKACDTVKLTAVNVKEMLPFNVLISFKDMP
jgi:hypothetical protein